MGSKAETTRSPVVSILERVAGIEPAYSAWKAAALPLCYTRLISKALGGGGDWIRTNVHLRDQIYSLTPLTTRPPLLLSFQKKAAVLPLAKPRLKKMSPQNKKHSENGEAML